jgi:hypothetical protein
VTLAIAFEVHYLIQKLDGEPKIFGWVSVKGKHASNFVIPALVAYQIYTSLLPSLQLSTP